MKLNYVEILLKSNYYERMLFVNMELCVYNGGKRIVDEDINRILITNNCLSKKFSFKIFVTNKCNVH